MKNNAYDKHSSCDITKNIKLRQKKTQELKIWDKSKTQNCQRKNLETLSCDQTQNQNFQKQNIFYKTQKLKLRQS